MLLQEHGHRNILEGICLLDPYNKDYLRCFLVCPFHKPCFLLLISLLSFCLLHQKCQHINLLVSLLFLLYLLLFYHHLLSCRHHLLSSHHHHLFSLHLLSFLHRLSSLQQAFSLLLSPLVFLLLLLHVYSTTTLN